jgi:hypothetical protein
MPILLEALNLAGSLGAIFSWPPLLAFALAYMALRATGHNMQGKWRWLYALIVISGLGYFLDLSDRFGWVDFQKFVPLEEVHDQTFQNERVLLDGHAYYHCKFTNVTFVTNGGRGVLAYSTIIGGYGIATDNSKIEGALGALNGLGALRFPLENPRTGVVLPPYGANATVIKPSDNQTK